MRSLVSLAVFLLLAGGVVYVADRQGHVSIRGWIADASQMAGFGPQPGDGHSPGDEEVASAPPVEDRVAEAPADEAETGAVAGSAEEVWREAPAAAAEGLPAGRPAMPVAEAPEPAPHPTVRAIAPGIVAPPELDPAELDRVEPREPLSELSLALPPAPETVDDWEGTTLFRPFAPAAGVVEAMGYSVSVAGAGILPAGQTCEHKGRIWDCGTRARTAFRGFLRGRAVICALPEGAAKGAVSAPCRIGRQNLGKWLVANGWAPAAPGGPFEEAGSKAREAGKGIYGPPPDMAEIGPVQVLEDLTPPVSLPMPAR